MEEIKERTPFADQQRPKPMGAPEVLGNAEMACPNCGCGMTMVIKVRFMECKGAGVDPLLSLKKSGSGVYIARYVGCPACPWASPAILSPEVSK